MILYFLPMILFLGIITSHEDVREGKIRNKWIIAALAYALAANLGIIVYYHFTGSLAWGYVTDLLLNVGIALAGGFLAWNYRVWSAGDAKLFLAYASLVPLSVYSYGYINYFPSLVILINTFVPFTIYLLFKIMSCTSTKDKLSVVKEIKPKDIGIMVVSLFSIYWLVHYISAYIGLSGTFTRYLLTFGIYYVLQKVIKGGKLVYAMAAVAVVRLVFDRTIWVASFWYYLLGFTLAFKLLHRLIRVAADTIFSRKVQVDELQKGMMIAQGIKKDNRIYKKIKDLKGSLVGLEPEGLTGEDIKWIKGHRNKFGFKDIRVQETMPFAPLLFAGVLLTLAAKGNFLIWIVKFIMYLKLHLP